MCPGCAEWRPREVIVWNWRRSLYILGDPKMLEMPESWDICWRKLLTGSGTIPWEGSVLPSTQLKGVGALKNILTLDMEMRFEIPDGFLVLFWSSISTFASLCIGMVMHILCHYMLEVCVFFFITVKVITWLRRDWTFKCLDCDRVRSFAFFFALWYSYMPLGAKQSNSVVSKEMSPIGSEIFKEI